MIHDPAAVLGLFEEDEGGAMATEVFSTEIKNGTTVVNENSYQLITAEPAMPKISVEAVSSNSSSKQEVSYRLKIEYRRDIRQDEDYFPTTGVKKIKVNEKWDIDFGDKIRGGRATLYCDYGSSKDTIVFYIRGTNPTEQAVKDYLTDQSYDIWFLTRLIRQESNYRHFNAGTNYGTGWNDSQGCPNFGPPHGWGLMQLDLLDGGQRPTAQQLWSWKANLDRGYEFLNGEKFNMVNNHFDRQMRTLNTWNDRNPKDKIQNHTDQTEGLITYSHSDSNNFTHDFGDPPTGTNRSLMDATWIKNYNGSSRPNGGSGYYYMLEQADQKSKPFWIIQNLNNNNHNYVEAVSDQAD